jgi:DNA-binding response OmpR family regulator
MIDVLSQYGCLVYVVPDIETANRYLSRSGEFEETMLPGLIVMDSETTGSAGRQFLKQIKEDVDQRRIPVIVLGSTKDQEDILGFYDSHACCYIAKDSDPEHMKKRLGILAKFWFSVVSLPQEKTNG